MAKRGFRLLLYIKILIRVFPFLLDYCLCCTKNAPSCPETDCFLFLNLLVQTVNRDICLGSLPIRNYYVTRTPSYSSPPSTNCARCGHTPACPSRISRSTWDPSVHPSGSLFPFREEQRASAVKKSVPSRMPGPNRSAEPSKFLSIPTLPLLLLVFCLPTPTISRSLSYHLGSCHLDHRISVQAGLFFCILYSPWYLVGKGNRFFLSFNENAFEKSASLNGKKQLLSLIINLWGLYLNWRHFWPLNRMSGMSSFW